MAGGGTVIEGLAIWNFRGNAIGLTQNGNLGVTVQGCYLGNNAAGTFVPPIGAFANGTDGIRIDSQNNTIGGGVPNTGNWICANGRMGVEIIGIGTTGNFLGRNLIGADRPGMGGNAMDGVYISITAGSNTVGGAYGVDSNTIVGNGNNGVTINGTNNNLITGNNIGTDAVAQWPNLANGVAVQSGAAGNTISNNVISGNSQDGVLISGIPTTGTTVSGNVIGLTGGGNAILANGGSGVHILDASDNTIGGMTAGLGNVVSGNTLDGIFIEGLAATNVVLGNFIGTDIGGTLSLGNSGDGVGINGMQNTIGGAVAGARNVISGNLGNGINFGSGGNKNDVIGNYIGTDWTGLAGLQTGGIASVPSGNGANGIAISGASANTIGGVGSLGNVISNNGQLHTTDQRGWNGVFIGGSNSKDNLIQGNYIGTDNTGEAPAMGTLGNFGDGIYVEATAGTGNIVGGTAARFGNVISDNGKYGIDFGVPVTEDWNIIGFGGDSITFLPNLIDGSFTGIYGANDIHQ